MGEDVAEIGKAKNSYHKHPKNFDGKDDNYNKPHYIRGEMF